MATIIYKESSYVIWNSKNAIIPTGINTGSYIQPSGGLSGAGVAGQVAVWSDVSILTGFTGLTYEEDSNGNSILQITSLPEKTSETNIIYYDPATGLLSYGEEEGNGDSLWEDIGGILSPTPSDAVGIEAGGLHIENNIISIIDPSTFITLVSGDTFGTSYIYIGDSSSSSTTIAFQVQGSATDVYLGFSAKGQGSVIFNGGDSALAVQLGSIYLNTPMVYVGYLDEMITSYTNSSGVPHKFTIKGQDVNIDGSGNANGGGLYLYGGAGSGSGVRGDVYFGDGDAGYLKARTAETNVVYYDPSTGLLSYGVGSQGGEGDSLWQEVTGYLTPITAGEDVRTAGDMYANDFILLP